MCTVESPIVSEIIIVARSFYLSTLYRWTDFRNALRDLRFFILPVQRIPFNTIQLFPEIKFFKF